MKVQVSQLFKGEDMHVYLNKDKIVTTKEVVNVMLTAKGISLRNGVLSIFETNFDLSYGDGKVVLTLDGSIDYPSAQSILRTVGVILEKIEEDENIYMVESVSSSHIEEDVNAFMLYNNITESAIVERYVSNDKVTGYYVTKIKVKESL